MFYLISQSADRIKEGHLNIIYPILARTGISPQEYLHHHPQSMNDLIRYANSLMNLLQKIEHLLMIPNPVIFLVLNLLIFLESSIFTTNY